MIKSKLSAEEAEHKPYPVPEEDSFIPPDDDSAEIKYMMLPAGVSIFVVDINGVLSRVKNIRN